MKISIITLFPEVITTYLKTSIMGRAAKKGLVEYEVVDLRPFGEGPHLKVDDKPFGGGVGLVLRADILAKALSSITTHPGDKKTLTILTSASGQTYQQSQAQKLSDYSHLIIVCGHYEGVDQRFIDKYVDLELSIGDYVLTGGELPALVISDSVIRLIPGVLEKEEATQNESFSPFITGQTGNGLLLEYPHYTQPRVFEGMEVPEVLISGNHQKIQDWRNQKSVEKTQTLRPDLLEK